MNIKVLLVYTLGLLILMQHAVHAEQMEVSGIYQGKNVYVKNPFSPTGVGFCIYEVTVNGSITTDEINSSAFEIDFSALDVDLGDQLSIVIKYKNGCKPSILNPEVLLPRSTFEIKSMNLSPDGKLTWSTTGESGSLPFYIEQYVWNKWILVSNVQGKGTGGTNNYAVNVQMHSGKNKFRVRQYEEHSKKSNYSNPVEVYAPVPPVRYSINSSKTKISFTKQTLYEIYDKYGKIVTRSRGKEVDISNLAPGKYYLNYDSKMDEFKK